MGSQISYVAPDAFPGWGGISNEILFSDVEAEKELIEDDHIRMLFDFLFKGRKFVRLLLFWPYDFKFIPIETISAIYERFQRI